MTAFTHKRALTGGILCTFCCGLPTPTLAQESAVPPVLTICEALRNFNMYRGKDVVIVGRYGSTFEGPFMSEKCEADDRILIQGHRWLSMIALSSSEKSADKREFPVVDAILRAKLSQVAGYDATAQGSADAKRSIASGWEAVYGRLDTPAKLRPHVPPSASYSRNIPGNGYGANGTVPVRILVINQKSLP